MTIRTLFILAVAIASCANPEEGVAACPAARLPTHGARCDAAMLGKETYCRLNDCKSGAEDECRCRDGAWFCDKTARNNSGCGVPPTCRSQPCP